MSTLKEITAAALQLPAEERAALIDTLQDAFESEVVPPEFIAECERRTDELASGKVQGLTREESVARLRRIAECEN